MKAILISIRPKWCELIANGKKTVEVRKTRPKLETPFKVYIYQTLHREHNGRTYSDGKVIGEFVCDKICDIKAYYDLPTFYNQYECHWIYGKDDACLSFDEMNSYLKGNDGHGWHISELVIYDKPKELSEFWNVKCSNKNGCSSCYIKPNCITHITRPPQSWCYVEEMKG